MTAPYRRYYRLGRRRASRLTHISQRHRLAYVSIPKSGCTIVKTVLLHAELGRPPRPGQSVHDRKSSPLAAPLKDGFDLEDLFGPGSDYLTFTFVRNPYSRVLSTYLQKIQLSGREQRERRASLGFGAEEDVSFHDFLTRLVDEPPGKTDSHWAPQAWVGGFGRMPYGFVGRLESFDTDMRQLVELAGLDVHESVWQQRTGHSTGARSRLREYYSDRRCVELVQQVYAEDFRLLGYGLDPRFA